MNVPSEPVAGLHAVLGGPLELGQTMVIAGEPGSGKTILASQIAFAFAKTEPVLIVTLTSESQSKLLRDLRGFSFFDDAVVGSTLRVISGTVAAREGREALRKLIVDSLTASRAKLVVIDGVRAIREMWRDEATVREFFYELSVVCETRKCAAIYTAEYSPARVADLAEGMTSDAVIAVTVEAQGLARTRRLEVVKRRGHAHFIGSHAMLITKTGVSITPRLEVVAAAIDETPDLSDRATFGLPVFDALLHGGLPRGSTTTLAGGTGIGKTLLSLAFASAGARAGEPSLFVTFDESPSALTERAKRVGNDVASLVKNGTLTIRHVLPLELEPDVWATSVLNEVRRLGARRVVIDGISALNRAMAESGRADSFMVALVTMLRAERATSIFAVEVPKLTGAELDFGGTPLQSAAENLVLLRHLELSGRLHRVLSILKMRSSEHDWHLREFAITPNGIVVLEALPSHEGVLK